MRSPTGTSRRGGSTPGSYAEQVLSWRLSFAPAPLLDQGTARADVLLHGSRTSLRVLMPTRPHLSAPTVVEQAEQQLRAALTDLGLDDASVGLFASAAVSVAAVHTHRPLASLTATATTRANRPTDEDRRPDDEALDATALRSTASRVLGRIEDLQTLVAQLDGAVVAAAGELTTSHARLLLAEKGLGRPEQLSPSARERWAARSRSTTAHELAAATGWGTGETRDLVALSTAPAEITSLAVTALRAGTVPWRLVRRYWRACQGAALNVAQSTHVAQVLFGTDQNVVAVERLTPEGEVSALPWAHPPFHHALDREIARITATDPRTTIAARDNAKAARDARADAHDDGTATVTITASPTQVAAIADRLHTAARAARHHGDTRTLAQLRADIACALLMHATLTLPQLPADPDLVTVEHTTALAAILQGLPAGTLNVVVPYSMLHRPSAGQLPLQPHRCAIPTCPATTAVVDPGHHRPQRPPITSEATHPGEAFAIAEATGATNTFLTADAVADLVLTPGTTLHRLLVDPADGRCVERSTIAYQPDADLRAQAMAADGTCRAPGCTRAAVYAQLDHVHEHAAGGPTTLGNLQCLCTVHHDLKTARHWHATINTHRAVTWTTLLGRIYRTRVRDHRQYLTLLHAATTAVEDTAARAAADGSDPRTARAGAIDTAVYAALCHRATTDPLPAVEDSRTDDSWTDSAWAADTWTADPATTVTHTDTQGRRRWGPPPSTPADSAADGDEGTPWGNPTYGPPPF